MARYVLKLPPLPQMGYYQDKHAADRPFAKPQTAGRQAQIRRGHRSMGGGKSCGGGGDALSDEDDPGDKGCLEALRRRRSRSRGPRGRRLHNAQTAALQAGLVLQHDVLRFTGCQLVQADAVLADIVRDDGPSLDCPPTVGVEAVGERLVQRLLCAVGSLDSRFACKYLVCLDRRVCENNDSLTIEYLVRLDELSTPALYQGDLGPPCRILEGAAQEAVPQGFARVQVQPDRASQWAEFISPNGFLRRDKVQERFVELLATAAAPMSSPRAPDPDLDVRETPTPAPRGPRGPHSPLQVDESRLCGAPGKVIDAALLSDLLQLPADGQIFLASGTERFPDPRDARIAIVEGSPWIRLRLGLTRDVLVKLVLGIGVDRWPRGSDLPSRVPLTHPNCLLYQHLATTGCFLVTCGPPLTIRCDDRPCTWQIWFPCATAALLGHYGPRSAVSRSLRALEAVRRALALRSVSRHVIRALLLWRLERGSDVPGSGDMAEWVPGSAVMHVIGVLDRLVCILRGASERCYLFPSLHILAAASRQGVPAGADEEAVLGDATALSAFLRRLHADCTTSASRRSLPGPLCYWPGEEDQQKDCWTRLEEELLSTWEVVLKDNAPPNATRSRRLGFRASNGGPTAETAQFEPRQLLYIGALLRGLLLARSSRIEGSSSHSWFPGTMRRHPLGCSEAIPSFVESEAKELNAASQDVACLVAVILEQARNYALRRPANKSTSRSPRRGSCDSARSNSSSRKRPRRSASAFCRRYDAAVDKLLEAVRSDPGVGVSNPIDDSTLVSCVMRWLLVSVDRAPSCLASPLRRFLRALSTAANQAAPLYALWAASRIRARDELAATAVFCRLIDAGTVTPLKGIVESADKGWEWARWLVHLSARLPGGVHGLLAPAPGRVLRFSLPSDSLPLRWTPGGAPTPRPHKRSAPSTASNTPHTTMTPSVAKIYRAALAAGAGGPSTDVVLEGEATSSDQESDNWEPLHGRLRNASPLSALLQQRHRLGIHRAIGDLLPALLALRKFSAVQEAAFTLPEPFRSEALDGISRICRETRRRSAARSRIIPTLTRTSREPPCEVYRSCTELSPLQVSTKEDKDTVTEADRKLEEELRKLQLADTLLGTCRAARAAPNMINVTSIFEDHVINSPIFPTTFNPAIGPSDTHHHFLEMTHDKQLRLGPPPKHKQKKRDVVTKL